MSLISLSEVQDIIEKSGHSFIISPASLAFLNEEIEIRISLGNISSNDVVPWINSVIDRIPDSYNIDGIEIKYESLTLTPWDLFDAFGWEEDDKEETMLQVSMVVDNQPSTMTLSMDQAMGMYLFCKVANVNLYMTMNNELLTYFNENETDIYLRYNDRAIGDENYIKMIGSDRKYFFHNNDFIRGIAAAARFIHLDHHNYWTECKNIYGDDIDFF